MAAEDVQFGAAQVQLKLIVNVASLLIKRLIETVQRLLEVFLLVRAILEQKLAKVSVRVILEIVLDFERLTLERHGLQGLKLGPIEHLRRQFLAVERVVDPFFHVSLLLLRRHLRQLGAHGLELLIGEVVNFLALRRRKVLWVRLDHILISDCN